MNLERSGPQYITHFEGSGERWKATHQLSPSAEWQMEASMSGDNDWANYTVGGVTEHHQGFRRALKAIVKAYPELLAFLIRFMGEWVPIRELVSKPIRKVNWKSILFFHGTTEQAWHQIQQHGLKPRGETNAAPGYGGGNSPAGAGRVQAIYLASQLDMAQFAASQVSKRLHSPPVILSVHGIDGRYVEADEDSDAPDGLTSLERIGSIAYLAPIPASKIHLFQVLENGRYVRTASYDYRA